MRIALYDNLRFSGGKRQEFEMARGFTRAGHTVDLFTTTEADSAFLRWEDVTREQHTYDWPRPRPLPSRLPGFRGYITAADTLLRVGQVAALDRTIASDIDAAGYDLVLVHHCPMVQAPTLLRYSRTPTVYYCNEPARTYFDPAIPRPYDHKDLVRAAYQAWYAPANWMVNRVKREIGHHNIHHADVLVANSYFSAESIYRAYQRHPLVGYLGVDHILFRPQPVPREDYVMTVGEVKPHKAHDFIIKALGHLPADRRPPLLIVSNNVVAAERSYLARLAEARGVRLTIREMVPDEELASLYARARAFVYAPVLEPFGMAPLEALACETPVVGVAEGGVRESIQPDVTGLLVQREPQLMAEALDMLLADQALQRRLGRAGRESVDAFWNWPASCERLLAIVTRELGIQDRAATGALPVR